MTALQYGGGQGTEELRAQICEVMAAEGIVDARPENVVITAGSQSAQDVATKVFCNPGDVVLVEDPTYVGALNTFEAYQVQVETVAWTTTAWSRAARGQDRGTPDRRQEHQVPVHHPQLQQSVRHHAGPGTPAADRRYMPRANILVLEDNPYGLLRFDGKPLAPLRAANPDDVIYMGSFSKIFAPGLRIGWALVPAHLQRRYYLASEAVTLCPPTLNQMLVSAYLRDYDWRGQIETYRGLYAGTLRRNAGRPGGAHARRAELDAAAGRLLRVGHAARGCGHLSPAEEGHRRRRRLHSRRGLYALGRPRQTSSGWRSAPCRRRPSPRACGGWRRCCGKP